MNIMIKTIEALCRTIEGAVYDDGRINVTKAAAAIGLEQPTLHRILTGKQKQIRPHIEEKLCEYFRISVLDLYSGKLVDGYDKNEVNELLERIINLSPKELIELQSRMPGVELVLKKPAS